MCSDCFILCREYALGKKALQPSAGPAVSRALEITAMEAAPMKLLAVLSTAGLLLLLGIAAADARQEQHGRQEKQEKAPKQEGQAKPETRHEQAKGRQEQQQQDKSARQEQQQQAKGQQDRRRQERQQQDKSAKQEQQQQAKGQQDRQRQERQQQDKSVRQEQQHQQQANRSPQEAHHGQPTEQRVVWQQDRAHSWQSEHRTWQQRGGYSGYRVPEDRFRRSFGRDHGFRIYSLPVVVVGTNRRFQYGGYWFSLVDPWPEYWSDNWYDNDDVYLDYSDDGYYMYNRRHPGDRLAISLYVN
jgi:hypothetical protein